MIKRELVMRFITERDHLGNEKYKKVTLKVRPELTDSVLSEVVDMYCGLTSNELVEATVVDTRDLVGNGDFEEIEEIFSDEEQEAPTIENEEGSAPKEAESSPDQETLRDKTKTSDVDLFPDKGEAPEVEAIPDKGEAPEVEAIPDKEEAPGVEAISDKGETPKVEIIPDKGEAPEVEGAPEVEAIPDKEKAPEVEAIPDKEEAPEIGAIPDKEEAPEVEAISDKEEVPEVEAIPDKVEAPGVETIPDKVEAPEVEAISDKGDGSEVEVIPDSGEALEVEAIPDKGWTQLWTPKTTNYLDNLFTEKFLKRAKKDKLLGKKPTPIPTLLGRDHLANSKVQGLGKLGYTNLLKTLPPQLCWRE